MKHAVLGTGAVGRTIASKLIHLGHEVRLGARTTAHEGAEAWARAHGPDAGNGAFADVAGWADLVWLAVTGEHAVDVAVACGAALDGKVLLDLTNPLDFSRGFPPRLFVGNDDSLGEQVQRAVPRARVVKSLNTLANALMVAPDHLPEPTDVFVAGDDPTAKELVAGVLRELGHADPIDVGGIEAARGLEAWLLLWTRLFKALGTGDFNLRLVRAR